MDLVFKALADPTRRRLLDSLREEDGQTLGRLCSRLEMTRQSVTQHLEVLREANLISVVRRGRERWHYLNPVPIHELQQRWIAPFEQPRLGVLDAIRRQAEEPRMKPDFVYVTYIHATPERVWEALTDADLTGAYWGHSNVSDWRPGSPWEHRRVDGSEVADAGGVVLEVEPPRRLVMTFGEAGAPAKPDSSTVTFLVEPYHDIVRLTVTHVNLATDDDLAAVSLGWPAVMANLKSLLETGRVLPQAPWEVPATL
ncbi:metalloregulator ArsR/SmtB family transcription factor [Actinoplanes hulinensis]|uniref:Metalloregulator ArsR/SmtB family transcription factor n=1 Tax=Actinoplanes hulinensis TaxID=1144547 RepID=A0ABS7B3P5_9ACTN|nr:metalloregulator ArsR/SmtB family transcription factor [Actinoplanes hulinensis]MBW6435658.1 metalloregulator ArsR/SmtB family transcription factor [Actinoplanes hulinensis]